MSTQAEVAFNICMLRGLVRNIRELLGTGGEALLFCIGYQMGIELARTLRGENPQESPWQILDRCGDELFRAGWGKFEFIDAYEYKLARVHGSWECKMERNRKKPYSQIYRGLISGLFSELFSQSLIATEVKCLTCGYDFCEFKIKPRK